MITDIIKLLAHDDFYNESEEVEFAKGQQYLPLTFKGAWTSIKRKFRWRKK